MCNPLEIYNRTEVEKGSQSHFEMNQNGELFETLAIGRYNRSAADRNVNDPKSIRPPQILLHTVCYMRDCLADLDMIPEGQSFYKYQYGQKQHFFIDIYSFLRDRMRQITQELTVLNEKSNFYSIQTTEQICRFLILSYQDCFQTQGFDAV